MPIINLAPPESNPATKAYIDSKLYITMHSSPPPHPVAGDIYFDQVSGHGYLWIGNKWVVYSSNEKPRPVIPSDEELEKHPSLKQAWEEYMVIRKLLGL